MSVNATCGKCNEQLVNDTLKLEDGSKVQISKCPSEHGKIKSPFILIGNLLLTNFGISFFLFLVFLYSE